MCSVLRLGVGDSVRVFDGRREFVGRISDVEKGRVLVEIEEEVEPLKPPIHLAVAFSPPKGKRMDELIEKLVEMGASELIPTICERTVRRPREKKDRWERIILSSVKQCERTDIPKIKEPMRLGDVLTQYSNYNVKIAGLIGGRTSIYDAPVGEKTIILIGPEGDFTDEEREEILKAGFVGVSLGRIILRVETAAIVSAAVIMQKSWKDYEGSNIR